MIQEVEEKIHVVGLDKFHHRKKRRVIKGVSIAVSISIGWKGAESVGGDDLRRCRRETWVAVAISDGAACAKTCECVSVCERVMCKKEG